jgi:hypothetical protein
MNNIINIFFLCAHYTIYIYLLVLIYKKFVRPYLLHEQQQERALVVQLEQKLSTAQALAQTFRNQVDYLTTIFNKISQQQKQARAFNEKLAQEHMHEQSRIQVEYAEQQKTIAYKRQIQETYQAVAPEVIQELRSELKHYAQDHGKHYLEDSIKALKDQSEFKSKR